MKPFLKWIGGKRNMAAKLQSLTGSWNGTYHEPFLGGGALFWSFMGDGENSLMSRTLTTAHLSDSNTRLIATWKALQEDPTNLQTKIQEHLLNHSPEYYAEVRARDIDSQPMVDIAAWFIYINRAGFNGLYRVNKKGICNTPIGRCSNPARPPWGKWSPDALTGFSDLLNDAEIKIYSGSYIGIQDRVSKGDLVYFDPPYAPLSATAKFTSYTSEGFSWQDQSILAELSKDLVKRGVTVIASNHDVEGLREMYEGFEAHTISASRNVRPSAARKVQELIFVGKPK